jgi:hypothetical protein
MPPVSAIFVQPQTAIAFHPDQQQRVTAMLSATAMDATARWRRLEAAVQPFHDGAFESERFGLWL